MKSHPEANRLAVEFMQKLMGMVGGDAVSRVLVLAATAHNAGLDDFMERADRAYRAVHKLAREEDLPPTKPGELPN